MATTIHRLKQLKPDSLLICRGRGGVTYRHYNPPPETIKADPFVFALPVSATFRNGRCSIYGLLFILMGGCSTPLSNPVVPNAANIWVGSTEGTGRWSAKPGDADIEITGVDAEKGVFPPLSYLDTAADLSAPLHLVPGRHSISLLMGAVFPVYMGPTAVSETVASKGLGAIEVLFLANHAYRITAEWNSGPRPGNGTFKVTLWDITQNENPDNPVRSWIFRGWEYQGPVNHY